MTNSPDIPNLRHLRMVQMIGRLNGVSAAARHVNTSQPAVTQAVATIETLIGAPLFDRRATGTFPTEVGRLFLRRVDRFFEILDAAIGDLLSRSEALPEPTRPQVERYVTGTQLRSLVVAAEPAMLEVTASEMNVTSSSLFRSARTLERALGRKMFDRTADGPTCNQFGLYLARQVRRAVREIEFGMAEVTQALGEDSQEIVVGLLPMAGTYEMAGAVRRFNRLRPTTRVSVRVGTYHALRDDLANCRIDMIFGLLRAPDTETEVEEEAMFADSYCIVCRPGHPLTRVRRVSAGVLAGYDWIAPVKGSQRRAAFEDLFTGTGLVPRGNIEVGSLNCARAILLESDMVTVMARSEIRLDLRLGTLVSVDCPALENPTQKGVTTRSDWLPTEGHLQFLDCLRRETAETARSETAGPQRVALAC
ncbi:LysR family transcriptional regulator [Salipiger sp.]|uniref:LysR family transcriptional regulator n=1 Tax=Salipiger sp. TaxID=2078585 RepID=UPI003A96B12C